MPVAPPAFSLTVQTNVREHVLLALWCVLAAAALGAWLALHGWALAFDRPPPDGLALAGALVFGLPAALGGWHALPMAAAHLTWGGGRWGCSVADDKGTTPVAGQLEPMIDLGIWMLVRFRSTAPPFVRWLVVDASSAGAAWHPIRAALFQPVAGASAAKT